MSNAFARGAWTLLAVALSAAWLPWGFDALFADKPASSLVLHSPVTGRFVFRDAVPSWREAGLTPEERAGLHHGALHRDHDGRVLAREEFEKLLPFLYPENMAVWGLLPLELGGASFDKDALYRERQTFELKPDMLPGLGPAAGAYPLLESRPERAGLSFPEDRFRLGDRLEFVNADSNGVDEALTERFTAALAERGCVFPLRAAFGQDSIFKPFDEGWLLLDASGGLFRLRRERDQPVVAKVELEPGVRVRAVRQRENVRRQWRGLLLAEDGRVFLMDWDFRLTPLPSQGFDPERMDYKFMQNALYASVIYGDDRKVRATSLSGDLSRTIETVERAAPNPAESPAGLASAWLFPLRIDLEARPGQYVRLVPRLGDWRVLAGNLILAAALVAAGRGGRRPTGADVVWTLAAGLHGLLARLALRL